MTGSLTSPDYPSQLNGEEDRPVDCTWNIHGQPGEIIVLDVPEFFRHHTLNTNSNPDLGGNRTLENLATGPCNTNNGSTTATRFEVRDGLNDSLLWTFSLPDCGKDENTSNDSSISLNAPKLVTSHSNRMYIRYTTDGSATTMSPTDVFKVNYRRGECSIGYRTCF